jgi:4-amino-4-deoxy-L-arabinose transferase-like glycosyltransferase
MMCAINVKLAPSRDAVLSDNPSRLTGFWLFLLALVTRLVFLFLAGNNGTDAWERYLIARSWLQAPSHLPSEVWLPMHFWFLGASLFVWNSEWAARLLTVLFGALTALPYWGLFRRVFNSRVAFWSTLVFAFFGLHIAYSVTTSSEGPTIFFLVFGCYAWVRFREEEEWRWALLSGLAFSAASLCRVEPWLYIPVLTLGLLERSPNSAAAWPTRKAWLRMIGFAAFASVGAVGWMSYSFLKWGDPFAVATRSAWLSAHLNIHQPLLHRMIAVPGALFVTLSPFILVLAIIGLIWTLLRAELPAFAIAALVLILIAANLYTSLTKNSTMARYTLVYSWLLIPFAFEALQSSSLRWPWLGSRKAFAGITLFFLVWQAGTIVGAQYGPPTIADKLSSVSPTLPLSVELRSLVLWLRTNRTPEDAVIIDDFNYEASDVIRYARIPQTQYYRVPYLVSSSLVQKQVQEFLANKHPRFLVFSPQGQLGSVWALDKSSDIQFDHSDARLDRRWQQGSWEIFEIRYEENTN